MATVHFVVKQADGRELPVCYPEGLPAAAASDMFTRMPERVTCAACLAVLTGDAGTVTSSSDGGAP